MDTIIRQGQEITKNWVTIKRGQTFEKFGTTPDNWRFTGLVKHNILTTCELCDTVIVWQYALVNRATDKKLWVGSECVKWYYESWQPNGLEMLLLEMKKATRTVKKAYIAEKLEVWKVKNPIFYEYLLGVERRGYQDVRIRCYENGDVVDVPVSKFRTYLRSKGYLTTIQQEKLAEGMEFSSKFAADYQNASQYITKQDEERK